jgi:hypothetical protein
MEYQEGKKWGSVVNNRSVEKEIIEKGKKEHQLCLGKEDIKHTLFSCLERRKWRM